MIMKVETFKENEEHEAKENETKGKKKEKKRKARRERRNALVQPISLFNLPPRLHYN